MRTPASRSFLSLLLGFLAVMAPSAGAQTSPPGLLHLEGRLTDSTGVPASGATNIVLRLYDTGPGAGGTLLITDDHTTAGATNNPVTVTNGLYVIELGGGDLTVGSQATVTACFANVAAVWMEMQVGAETLTPRTRMLSAGYALNADALDGRDSTYFATASGTVSSITGGTGVDPDASSTGAVTVTADLTELTLTGLSAGGATSLSVSYGTAANTAVQGNQTGAITAGNGLTGDMAANALGDGFSASLAVGAGTGIAVAADSVGFAYTATVGTDPALNAGEAIFGTTGLIFEGGTANTFEGLLTVTDPTVSDKTWTLPDTTGTILLTTTASGNYVSSITGGAGVDPDASSTGAVTVTADLTELTLTGLSAGGATSLSVSYGTGANTAVQGNQTGAITAGNGLTGDMAANALGDGFSASLAVGAGTGIAVAADSVGFAYAATLAASPALNAGEAIFGTTGLIFEGSAGGADASEGLLTVTNPTADRTWTLPDADGTISLGGITGFATPSLTLGTANAAGVATTVIRSDATILAFDATVPGALGAAAAGTATVAARRDHVHPSINLGTGGGTTFSGTLPVGYGGTGTSTAFTQGSAVFAGASGVYTQDNANYFWDDTNNRLGLGTASPSTRLHVLNGITRSESDPATMLAAAMTDENAAVYGKSYSGASAATGHIKGVYGYAYGSSGAWEQDTYGVLGRAYNTASNGRTGDEYGVYGLAEGGTGGDAGNIINAHGVYGNALAGHAGTSAGTVNYGVRGLASGPAATGAGTVTNYGVYGASTSGNTGYGVYGIASGATTNWAGYFNSRIGITGSTVDPIVLNAGAASTGIIKTAALTAARTWTLPDASGTLALSGSAAPVNATYITQTADATLTAEQALSALATGYMKVTTTTGVVSSQAVPIPAADGGTGQTSYTVGDLLYASAATTLSKLLDVATGSVLVSGGAGVAPAWSTSPTLSGNLTVQGNTTLGDAATDAVTVTGEILGASPMNFEGATNNDVRTTFAITDPTGARTITFPDVSGTVITTGNLSAITTTGTISSGTWNGTVIGTQYGGTGQNWSAVATGSLPYFSGAGTMGTMAAGTSGYVLTSNGAGVAPTWQVAGGASEWTDAGDYLTPVDGGGIRIYETGASAGYITGVVKLDALRVDPPIQIDGKKYSTWGWDGIGLRTDVVGEGELRDGVCTIDLSAQPEKSDLWLFWKVVAGDTIVPFVTPQDQASLMARMDGSVLTVKVVSGVRNAKFSYRLSGKRIDMARPAEEVNVRDHDTPVYLDVDKYDKNGNLKE